MAKLKDYLGSLISGVNKARVLADLESAKIAEAYAEHKLLKHFPVPRFRAQDVELDIPLAIESVIEQQVTDYQPIENVKFNSAVYNVARNVAKVSSFRQDLAKILRSDIAGFTRELETRLKAGSPKQDSFDEFKEQVAESFFNIISMDEKLSTRLLALYGENSFDQILERLKNKLQKVVYGLIQDRGAQVDLEDSEVIVEAHRLKEMNPQSIVRLKLKITEEGMEWHRNEDEDGDVESTLLPE